MLQARIDLLVATEVQDGNGQHNEGHEDEADGYSEKHVVQMLKIGGQQAPVMEIEV